MVNLVSVIFCIWLALKIRYLQNTENNRTDHVDMMIRSIRFGLLTVTTVMLLIFGFISYFQGSGMPSLIPFLICTGLVTVIFMGVDFDITDNILIDSFISSLVCVGFCFTVVNGIKPAYSWLNLNRLSYVILASVFMAIIGRALLWLREEE